MLKTRYFIILSIVLNEKIFVILRPEILEIKTLKYIRGWTY